MTLSALSSDWSSPSCCSVILLPVAFLEAVETLAALAAVVALAALAAVVALAALAVVAALAAVAVVVALAAVERRDCAYSSSVVGAKVSHT